MSSEQQLGTFATDGRKAGATSANKTVEVDTNASCLFKLEAQFALIRNEKDVAPKIRNGNDFGSHYVLHVALLPVTQLGRNKRAGPSTDCQQ